MKPQIVSETPILMAELKEELEQIKKAGEDENMRTTRTYEYLSQLNVLSKKDAEDLKKKIGGLNIPRLKDEHIIKIIDTMPETADEVKVVLQGFLVTVTQENMKKIADKVKEAKGDKK